MRVLVILNNDFEDLEANGSIIIFRRAGYDVTVIGDTPSITSKYTTYTGLKTFDDIDFKDFDLLFLPGGGYIPSTKTNEAIKYFMEHNLNIVSICSAPTYLGHLGYLKNRKYVCFPSMNEDFGGTFVDDYVVVDGNIFTGRSVSAAMKLPLKVVETLSGKDALKKLKRQMTFLEKDI